MKLASLVPAALLLLAAASAPRADERMNGMVGLWYNTDTYFEFEYDYIAQFQKSKEWMGNITGPFVSWDPSVKSNRFGLGFVLGKRDQEKGTYAVALQAFEDNRWSHFSETRFGGEVKISLMVVGVKLGMMDWDWDQRYFAVGFSY